MGNNDEEYSQFQESARWLSDAYEAGLNANARGVIGPRALGRREFEKISSMVYSACGINLHEGKKELVRARLNKRLRDLRIDNFSEYLDIVDADAAGAEFTTMVDLLTTNLTHFFREESHFDFLRDEILPSARESGGLRIWCAGCSSGEEAYSLAITLREHLTAAASAEALILATDISSRMVAAARIGVYAKNQLSGMPPLLRDKYFTRLDGARGDEMYRVKPELASHIRFRRLNLISSWPMSGQFDVVFCRNVMIYFDKYAQKKLIDRFHDIIRPGGHLFVGHSESLIGVSHGFEYSLPSVYRKPCDGAA